jgi:flagellar export protein FliJ
MSPKSVSRILAVKERLRQAKRSELAEANASVDAASKHVDAISQMRAEAVRAVVEAGEIPGAELEARAQVADIACRDLTQAKAVLEERHKERDVRKEVVVEATREVRVMETLKERLQRVAFREETTREQLQLDELMAQRRRPT